MTKFDDELRAGLTADDKAFLDDLENGRGLFDQLGATLQGPMRFWTWMMGVYTLIFFGLAVFCGWNAFAATEVRETILWSAGTIIATTAVSMLKMWLFDRMNTLTLLGELKQIELRLAQLSEKRG
ncbi:DUF6768 family protein [Parasphingorhabdus sp.]|uniref:DUF6768 family protein n=1 Tax=Parasphingorhabdus sp. TaxID=2709688 RepID=UPI0032663007